MSRTAFAQRGRPEPIHLRPGQTIAEAVLEGFSSGLLEHAKALRDPEQAAAHSQNPDLYTHRRMRKYVGRLQDFVSEVLKEEITDDVKAVFDSVAKRPVTFAQSANGTGKTHGAARLAVAWYKCMPSPQVYTAAAPPEDNLKRLLWGEIGSIVEKHPHLFSREDQVSLASMKIQRTSLQFITGVTIPASGTPKEREGRFSGKHAPSLLFILDEGDAIPEEVYTGIESCMSGGTARLLVLFNPRMESGPIASRQKKRGGFTVNLTAFNHPNVRTGIDVFPGAVDRDITARRILDWTEPLAPDANEEELKADIFTIPEELVGHVAKGQDGEPLPPVPAGKRLIVVPSFSYMVLGRYPSATEEQLISRAWIDAARARYDAYVALHGTNPPVGVRPFLGFDIADEGKDTTVACWRYGGYVPPLDQWRKKYPDWSADHCFKIFSRKHARGGAVDGTGVGASVAPKMRRLGAKSVYKVMVASSPTKECELGQFNILRDQILYELREWLKNDSGAMLPPDEELIEELLCPQYWKNLRGKIQVSDTKYFKEKIGRSPDKLFALALTFAPNEETRGQLTEHTYA